MLGVDDDELMTKGKIRGGEQVTGDLFIRSVKFVIYDQNYVLLDWTEGATCDESIMKGSTQLHCRSVVKFHFRFKFNSSPSFSRFLNSSCRVSSDQRFAGKVIKISETKLAMNNN